jgi:hypothetical protein
MEKSTKFLIGLLVLGLVVVIAFQFNREPVKVLVPGSSSGTEHSFREFFKGGITTGGITATTSTATTYTTVAKDWPTEGTVLSWLPNVNTTISLSGTSTNALVPNVGDTAEVYFRNASSTAASSITFAAADANADLQFTEATGGDLVLNGLDWMKITVVHTNQFLYTFILDEMTEAD